MNDEKSRFERINALLERALERPENERVAWLESVCGDDTDILREVQELLTFDAEQTGGLRAAVQSVAAELDADDKTRYVGQAVGRFRITAKLADGGMGSVFLAEHTASDFDQQVAIKLLPKHRLDTTAARRFVEERRILAGLDHPNIARMIDGGTLPDGVPYIVMDYVQGDTIDHYCQRQSLGNDAVVDLALKLCDAVQYAHRKLVIHRDIKPSNVLVDQRGEPRLLDFGIAKLLTEDVNDPEMTRADQRIMTPMYASPEQIEGQPITTAADVYGLGLLLYRLLTGTMPYQPTGDTPRELAQAILSQPPETPSAAVATGTRDMAAGNTERRARLQQRALRGELDTILLTALQKSPERRYASVAALAEDLRRFRKGRPILARRDSPLYVARKFVARHRLPVGLVTAAAVGAMALATYYTVQLRVAKDTAEQTAGFLAGIFEASDPYRQNREDLTVAGLLEAGIGRLDGDESLSPLVRARLLTTIALVQRNLGNPERAETLALQALALANEHAGPNDDEVIAPLHALSKIKITAGEYPGARAFAERMLKVADSAHGRESEAAARATQELSVLAYRQGDIDAMGDWAKKTYAIRKKVFPPNDMANAVGATSLGLYHWQAGDLAKAREYYAESARIQEAQPQRNELQYANLLHNLALLNNDTGDYAEAAEVYARSIAIRKALAAEADPILPMSLYAMAHTQARLGNQPEAHRTFLDAVQRQAAVAGREKPMVAYALTGHGMLLEEMGAQEPSAVLLNEAERIQGVVFSEPHQDMAATWIGLSRLASRAGEYDRARQLVNDAIELRTRMEGADDFGTLRAYNALGRVEFASGNWSAAESALRHALDQLTAAAEGDHPFAVEARSWLGRVRLERGDAEGAIALLREALTLGVDRLGADHVENVYRRLWLADALIESGDRAAGQLLHDEASAELTAIEDDWQRALSATPLPTLDEMLGASGGNEP